MSSEFIITGNAVLMLISIVMVVFSVILYVSKKGSYSYLQVIMGVLSYTLSNILCGICLARADLIGTIVVYVLSRTFMFFSLSQMNVFKEPKGSYHRSTITKASSDIILFIAYALFICLFKVNLNVVNTSRLDIKDIVYVIGCVYTNNLLSIGVLYVLDTIYAIKFVQSFRDQFINKTIRDINNICVLTIVIFKVISVPLYIYAYITDKDFIVLNVFTIGMISFEKIVYLISFIRLLLDIKCKSNFNSAYIEKTKQSLDILLKSNLSISNPNYLMIIDDHITPMVKQMKKNNSKTNHKVIEKYLKKNGERGKLVYSRIVLMERTIQ